ncbi:MAG: hypothetical protein SNJ69_07580 [Chloroflexaceae bacterium]
MKYSLLPGLVLAFALMLGACASGSQTGETEPTAAPAVATATTVVMEPTTAVVEPTSVTPQPAPAPATPEAQPTPVASAEPQTACDHPYLPLRPGATWTYRERAQRYTVRWTVTDVEGDRQTATARMESLVEVPDPSMGEDVRLEYTWRCSAEEGIVSFDYVSLTNANRGSTEFRFEIVENEGEGVMLPPVGRLMPGQSWNLSSRSTIRMVLPDDTGGPGMGDMGGTSETQVAYTVVEALPVTFAGSTYDGLKVQQETRITTNITIGGVSAAVPATTTTVTSISILARGIGYVVVDEISGTENGGMELVEYSIP